MPRRQYRRRIHFPGHLRASVSTSVQQAVEELADEAGWSYAEVVRACIDVGLPVVKSRVTTLEELADETGWSYAEVVRECIDVGLPVVRASAGRSKDIPSSA